MCAERRSKGIQFFLRGITDEQRNFLNNDIKYSVFPPIIICVIRSIRVSKTMRGYLRNIKQTAPSRKKKLTRYFQWNGSFRYKTANTEKTIKVITSCVIFNWKPDIPPENPNLFAGTIKQYSKNAIPQLIRIAFHNGIPVFFKCPYHAKVIKMLDAKSRMTALNIND